MGTYRSLLIAAIDSDADDESDNKMTGKAEARTKNEEGIMKGGDVS